MEDRLSRPSNRCRTASKIDEVCVNFRLSSLLITTTGICCLFGMFTVLGPDALFFLVPIACTCLGYLIGWRSRYPVTGAVFGYWSW